MELIIPPNDKGLDTITSFRLDIMEESHIIPRNVFFRGADVNIQIDLRNGLGKIMMNDVYIILQGIITSLWYTDCFPSHVCVCVCVVRQNSM